MPEIERPEWIDGGAPFGESLRSHVPADHRGPCAMLFLSGGREHWAIFPSREIAITAAEGACRRDVGGYSDVQIYPISDSPLGTKRYDAATSWLFEGEGSRGPIEGTGAAAIIRAALMFEHACRLGLEGIVSKRRDSRYRSGRSKDWIKVKNPDSPAMRRLIEE